MVISVPVIVLQVILVPNGVNGIVPGGSRKQSGEIEFTVVFPRIKAELLVKIRFALALHVVVDFHSVRISGIVVFVLVYGNCRLVVAGRGAGEAIDIFHLIADFCR